MTADPGVFKAYDVRGVYPDQIDEEGGRRVGAAFVAVTGAKRSVSAPEVPTFKELGYDGFDDLHVANGLLAPIGTPLRVAPPPAVARNNSSVAGA